MIWMAGVLQTPRKVFDICQSAGNKLEITLVNIYSILLTCTAGFSVIPSFPSQK